MPPGYPFRPELETAPREVRDLLKNSPGKLLLIDCRTPAEWKTAKIESAKLIPLNDLAAHMEEIEQAASEGVKVVVHCHLGGRSMKAAMLLRARGIDATSMAGGIDLWSIDIDPSVPRY